MYSVTHLPVLQEVKNILHILQHVKPQVASLPTLKQYKHSIIFIITINIHITV